MCRCNVLKCIELLSAFVILYHSSCTGPMSNHYTYIWLEFNICDSIIIYTLRVPNHVAIRQNFFFISSGDFILGRFDRVYRITTKTTCLIICIFFPLQRRSKYIIILLNVQFSIGKNFIFIYERPAILMYIISIRCWTS